MMHIPVDVFIVGLYHKGYSIPMLASITDIPEWKVQAILEERGLDSNQPFLCKECGLTLDSPNSSCYQCGYTKSTTADLFDSDLDPCEEI